MSFQGFWFVWVRLPLEWSRRIFLQTPLLLKHLNPTPIICFIVVPRASSQEPIVGLDFYHEKEMLSETAICWSFSCRETATVEKLQESWVHWRQLACLPHFSIFLIVGFKEIQSNLLNADFTSIVFSSLQIELEHMYVSRSTCSKFGFILIIHMSLLI